MKRNSIFLLILGLFFYPEVLSDKNSSDETTKELIQIDIPIYVAKDYVKPTNLIDISQDQIEQHWKLYKGYIDQVNKLNSELTQLRKEGKGNSLDYADRRRRYGFEYNGMILHEYYFENLKPSKEKSPNKELLKALEKSFGSFKNWQDDFIQAGKTRGIGWVILYLDPATNLFLNVFVQDHEVNLIAGFQPILVMDVWEHAYMVDFQATERPNYIDAFMKNINWEIVNSRYENFVNKK